MCLPEECSVVRGCKARQDALLRRIFEASGESWTVEDYEQEADFQVLQLIPDDWAEVSQRNMEESDAKWVACVGDSRASTVAAKPIHCSQEVLLELMSQEDVNARVPGDLRVLALQLESKNLSGLPRQLVQTQVLHSQRRLLKHFKTVVDLCIVQNCTFVFSQRILSMQRDVMRTIQSIKPMFARNLIMDQAMFLARFMMRECRGVKDDPWRMCWPDLAMKWLGEMLSPDGAQIAFQLRALTVSKSNQSQEFFHEMMTDVMIPPGLCFWSVCDDDLERADRVVSAIRGFFFYIITDQQVSYAESLANECRSRCFVLWKTSDRLQAYEFSRKFLQFMHLRYLRALCETDDCIAAVREEQEAMSRSYDFLRYFVPNVLVEYFGSETRLDIETLIVGLTLSAVCIVFAMVALVFGKSLWKFQRMMVLVGISVILWCALSVACLCLFGLAPHLSVSLNFFPSSRRMQDIAVVMSWSLGVIGMLQVAVFSVFLQQWIEALFELTSLRYPRVVQVSRIVLIGLNVGAVLTVVICLIYWTTQIYDAFRFDEAVSFLWKMCCVFSLISLAVVFLTCICCFIGLGFLLRRKLSYGAVLGTLALFVSVLFGQTLRVLYFFGEMFPLTGMTPMLYHGVGLFFISMPLCVFVFGAEVAFRKRAAGTKAEYELPSNNESNSVPLIPRAYEDY